MSIKQEDTYVSSGGGSSAPMDATYIVQTPNSTLTNEQVLSALATGIVKNTTTTGVLSIAVAGTDYLTPTGDGSGLTALGSIDTLSDVTTTTPTTDQVLRFNGSEWVNGQSAVSSASSGVSFYPDDTSIIASGTENTYPVKTLSKTPITSAEDVDSIACASTTVLYGTYLYDTALGRTSLDAGIWNFEVYAGVDSAAGTTSLRINTNRVRAGTGTITTTGTGTTRTAIAASGTPFATDAIDVGGTIDSDSFLQTTTGFFRILSRVSDTEITISTPTTYTNQTDVAYSVYKRLFQVTTGEINNTASAPLYAGLQLYSINSVQSAFTVIASDKISLSFLGVSTAARTVYFSHNGTTRYSHLTTPLSTMHGNLAGLQGGAGSVPTEEYYHLTSAQHTNLTGGTPSFTSISVTGASGLTLGTDVAGGSPNIAGTLKLFSAGDNAFYNTFTSGTNTANATYTLPTAMPVSSGQALVSTDAGIMSWSSFELSLTFSTGLTRATNTITSDISTGVSGGQTIVGSTSTDSGLTIKSTTGVGTTGADIIFQVGNNGATEAMRILNNGNVGIGTTSPQQMLDINGVSRFRNTVEYGPNNEMGTISWGSIGGGAGFGMKAGAGRTLTLGANNTWDYLLISTSGNIGIGTTAPAAKLHVDTNAQVRFSNSTTSVDGFLGGIDFYNTNVEGAATMARMQGLRGSAANRGTFSFETRNASGLQERLRIDENGNVGIGTTTPIGKIQINFDSDTDYASTSRGNVGVFIRNSTSGALNYSKIGLTSETNGEVLLVAVENAGNTAADFVLQQFNGSTYAEYIRVLGTNGNVGIGTTSPGSNLHVAGATGVEIGLDAATNTAGVIKMWSAGANNFYNTFTSGTNTANATYTLPPAMPAVSGYQLTCTDAGVMSWEAAGGLAWGGSITSTSGTGITTTIANSADAGTIGQSIVIDNTQSNAITGLKIDTGTSAQAHTGLSIVTSNASTSAIGININMGNASTGTGLYVTRTYTADDQNGVLAKFISAGAYNMAENAYRWIYDDADYGDIKMGTNADIYSAGSSTNDGYWLFLGDGSSGDLSGSVNVGFQNPATFFRINNKIETNHYGFSIYTGDQTQSQTGTSSLRRRIYATTTATVSGDILSINDTLDNNGAATINNSSSVLVLNRSVSQSTDVTYSITDSIFKIINAQSGSGGTFTDATALCSIQQHLNATGSSILIDHNSNNGATGAINIDQDANTSASTHANAIVVNTDNAGTDDQCVLNITMVDEAKSYFAKFVNATTAWTSSKNPESDAEAGWIKIDVGGTPYFVPYYAAS